MITAEAFDRFAPEARPEYRAHLLAEAGGVLAAAGIAASGRRLAHFMAQAAHECGLFRFREENLRYITPERLMLIFGAGRHSAAIAQEEVPGLLRNAEGLAERVYGLGNPGKAAQLGNVLPGDGFRYRGRGFLQITGRANYRRYGAAAGLDIEADPDRAAEPDVALRLAVAIWTAEGCSALADGDALEEITRRINGGLSNLAHRRALLAAAKAIWEGSG